MVTAAHCVSNIPSTLELTHVRLGEWDRSTNPDVDDSFLSGPVKNDPFVDVAIEDVIIHENFNASTKHNDIALVKLSSYVNYTVFIKPICLPVDDRTKKMDLTGKTLDVSGWGT